MIELLSKMKINTDKHSWTRAEVAEVLGVTVSRVSQIAQQMGIKMRWHRQHGLGYRVQDVSKMAQRDTKPGPKNGAKQK